MKKNYNVLWDCHTDWSKSEREKQISYINAYVRNLENGTDEPIRRAEIETQTKRTSVWTPRRGKEEWDELGDWIDTYSPLCVKETTNEHRLHSTGTLPSALRCQRGKCTAEINNTTTQINASEIFFFFLWGSASRQSPSPCQSWEKHGRVWKHRCSLFIIKGNGVPGWVETETQNITV